MKLDIWILETVFGIVLKFHDQTPPVEEVITIPVIILKQHAACCFIGLTMIEVYNTIQYESRALAAEHVDSFYHDVVLDT